MKQLLLRASLRQSLRLVLICGLLLSSTLPASATSVLPLDLQQLSTRASLIFYAEAIGNQTRVDAISGQLVTFTEFRVIDPIKGDAGETYTIKQLGGYDSKSDTRVVIHGVPVFRPGKRYVVFLPKPSTLGFCSPLGLQQGRFSVFRDNDEIVVSNGRHLDQQQTSQPASLTFGSTQASHNAQPPLTIPLPVSAEKPTRARLDDFINTVRAYNTP
jgi:hypothetical protein